MGCCCSKGFTVGTKSPKLKVGILQVLEEGCCSPGWRDVVAVLYEDSTFAWYKSTISDENCIGVVKLYPLAKYLNAGTYTANKGSKDKYTYMISMGTGQGKKTYWFKCSSERELNAWMDEIIKTLPAPKQPPPTRPPPAASLNPETRNTFLPTAPRSQTPGPDINIDNSNNAAVQSSFRGPPPESESTSRREEEMEVKLPPLPHADQPRPPPPTPQPPPAAQPPPLPTDEPQKQTMPAATEDVVPKGQGNKKCCHKQNVCNNHCCGGGFAPPGYAMCTPYMYPGGFGYGMYGGPMYGGYGPYYGYYDPYRCTIM